MKINKIIVVLQTSWSLWNNFHLYLLKISLVMTFNALLLAIKASFLAWHCKADQEWIQWIHLYTLFLNFLCGTMTFEESACRLIAHWQWVYFQGSITHLMMVVHQMQEWIFSKEDTLRVNPDTTFRAPNWKQLLRNTQTLLLSMAFLQQAWQLHLSWDTPLWHQLFLVQLNYGSLMKFFRPPGSISPKTLLQRSTMFMQDIPTLAHKMQCPCKKFFTWIILVG